jgi:hypothetical protein
MTDYLKIAALCNPDVLNDPPVKLSPEVYENHLRTLVMQDAPMGTIAPVLNETLRLKAEVYNKRTENTRLNEIRDRNVQLKEAQMMKTMVDRYDNAVRIEHERVAANQQAKAAVWKAVPASDPKTAPEDVTPPEAPQPLSFFERVVLEEHRRKEMAAAFAGEGISRMYASSLPPKQPYGIPPPTLRGADVELRLAQTRGQKSKAAADFLAEEMEQARLREMEHVQKRKSREEELGSMLSTRQGPVKASAPPPVTTQREMDGVDGILPKPRVHPIDVLQRQIAIALMESRVEEEAGVQAMYDLDVHLAAEIDSWGQYT